jgi:ATP:corrinoid adenosyltransferase
MAASTMARARAKRGFMDVFSGMHRGRSPGGVGMFPMARADCKRGKPERQGDSG